MPSDNQFNPGTFALHEGRVACILEVDERDAPDDNVKIEYVILDPHCTPLTPDDFTVTFTGLKHLQPLTTATQFLMAAAYALAYQRDELEDKLDTKKGEIASLAAAIRTLKTT